MAHLSENSVPLECSEITLNDILEFDTLETLDPDVWCILLPLLLEEELEKEKRFIEHLKDFSRRLHKDSLLTILTTPQRAAKIYVHVKILRKVSTLDCD